MTIIHTTGTIPGLEGEQRIAVLKEDTHLSRWIEQEHRLDADMCGLIPLVMDLMPEGGVVVDAGASLGDHTAAYATKAGVVHAFEPQPESFACLQHNCGELPSVKLYQTGLSDHIGTAEIARDPNVGASRIKAGGNVPIMVLPLDRLGISPALIKWDVEGHEVRALRGARMTILRFRPIMVIEVNGAALEAAGSSIAGLHRELCWLEYPRCHDIRTGVPFNPYDGKREYDIVCLP